MSNCVHTGVEKSSADTLTVKDVKAALKIGTNAAYNLIHSREFPVIRIGNSYRIPKAPFYAWLNRPQNNNN